MLQFLSETIQMLCDCFLFVAAVVLLRPGPETFRSSWYLAGSWSVVFALSNQRQAFPGVSYEQKDGLVRELAPERNNKLRRSLIHIHGRNGKVIYRCQKFGGSRLSVADVMGNCTRTRTRNLDTFLTGYNTVELNRHRRRTLIAVRIVGKTHHTCHA